MVALCYTVCVHDAHVYVYICMYTLLCVKGCIQKFLDWVIMK